MKSLIWVEGIIGAGKSTFCSEIAKRLNLRPLYEPVTENPYLASFYKEPEKYAFGMQVYLLHSRYAMQQLASYETTGVGGYNGAILDRSIAGDRVFAKLHKQAGNIADLDWQTYEMAYNIMARTLLPPTILLYLDVDPEIAVTRINKRNRKVESSIPIEYLKSLKQGYEELIAEAESGLMPWSHAIKVKKLSWNNARLDSDYWDETTEIIKSFF